MQRTAPALEAAAPTALARHDQRYINFTTAQHHFATISYAQVLQGQYMPETFRDKLVLVGATAAGLADSVPTPVSGLREPTPGVEFLANAMVSIREQTLISVAPAWLTLLVACALATLPLLWMPFTSAQTGLVLNIAYLFCVLLSCMALPVSLQTWIPMSAGMVGIFSAYPIWALRKLQSATRFLDEELRRLRQELKKWHAQDHLKSNPDPIQNRILQVQSATTQLIELEHKQREALAFVSHDIRVPIASAATLARRELGEQHPIHRQLSKALSWTEEFLHTSRAQMLDPGTFEKLDLIDLMHQVIDEMYPLAQERAQNLGMELPQEPAWIAGHFDSLSRAISNLLGNAIKFSPPQSVIGISVEITPELARVAISDQGPGIAADDLQRVFERFSQIRAKGSHKHSGVGLGLYYVQTVAHKHGAHVDIVSRPGQTTISILLPMRPEP